MVFTHDYDINLEHIIEVGQIFDSRRISSDIMRENKTQ